MRITSFVCIALALTIIAMSRPALAQSAGERFSRDLYLTCRDIVGLSKMKDGGNLLAKILGPRSCTSEEPNTLIALGSEAFEGALSEQLRAAQALGRSATNSHLANQIESDVRIIREAVRESSRKTTSAVARMVHGKPIRLELKRTAIESPEQRLAEFFKQMGPFIISRSDIEYRVRDLIGRFQDRTPNNLMKLDLAILHCVQVAVVLENLSRHIAKDIERYVVPCYTKPNDPLEIRRSELFATAKQDESNNSESFVTRLQLVVKDNDNELLQQNAAFEKRQREEQEKLKAAKKRQDEIEKAAAIEKLKKEQADAREAQEKAQAKAEADRRAALTPKERAEEDRINQDKAERVHKMNCTFFGEALRQAIAEGNSSKIMALQLNLQRMGC